MSEEETSIESSEASKEKDLPLSLETDPRQHIKKKSVSLANATFFLFLIALIQLVVICFLVFEKPPVHYVSGGKEGEAVRGKIPDDIVAGFARDYLQYFYNWNYANVDEVLVSGEWRFSRKVLASKKAAMSELVNKAPDLSLSEQMIVIGKPIRINKNVGGKVFNVFFKTNYRRYTKDTVLRNEDRFYKVVVERGSPGPNNSYGLYIFADEWMSWEKYRAALEAKGIKESVDEKRLKEKLKRIKQ